MASQTRQTYSVTFALRTPERAAAFVEKSDGTVYSVHAGQDFATCSCPDAMYRARECKHVVLVRAEIASPAKMFPWARFRSRSVSERNASLSTW